VLTEAVERKLRRCDGCPSHLDEGLHERLREWRGAQAKAQSLPAYCIFTDATLVAIAEDAPSSVAELAGIAGVGRAKLDKYGSAVLSLCRGGFGDGSAPDESDDIPDDWDESGALEKSPGK
jgi:DNA helicase-2/ATP-dependent DNA helicase PcrA